MHRDTFDQSRSSILAASLIVFMVGMLIAAWIDPPWMWWLTTVSMGWRIFAFAGSCLVLSGVVRVLLMVLPLMDTGYGRHAKAVS